MSSKTPSTFRQAWYKWKALKLPWRKRFFVGLDLQGNTFWEFRDTLSSHKYRMRRIVECPAATHYSEVKISPQWHQWLRHTRRDPPSLTEQSQDLVRQRQLKILAAQADARWAAKPSFLDTPERSQPLPALEVKDPGGYDSVQHRSEAVGVPDGGKEINAEIGEGGIEMQAPNGISHPFGKTSPQEKQRRGEEHAPRKEIKEDPWKNARGGPSEEWQPETWGGSVTARGR
ncbi:hypothetical protein B2J93_1769 [Marssonina coronariae]|uniref:Uncharacterized protein n=1 Tax=Diplocarpon coronariae TaxID=2795749 RepID=A0A218ZE52_9HELO|nr:hypothetical protein B2J93_1769 [Marssonina coronariae]